MDATPCQGIVNIVNFIRGVEPRDASIDLVEPVLRQRELARQHRLPVTWLVQYDAMLDPRFRDLLQQMPPEDEIGVWLEFVQPLVERAGLRWRGRFPWEWRVHVGFSIGYAPDERLRLIDVFLEEFQATFGFAPKAAGSWFIDAHSLAHLERRHGITAFCDCKDQWGTDGYTLWGGYFNQAYYPSRRNFHIPAQTAAAQINVPVFRMLGSDPINQYDIGIEPVHQNGQLVLTLEPSSPGGADPAWTDHFLRNMFTTPCLSFGYAQVGQENAFGWPVMARGLTYQHRRVAELRDRGLIRVETLSRSGAWFKARYPRTPPSAVVAPNDLNAPRRGALWFCSRHYRAGLIWDGAELRVRDLQLFDERRAEPFLDTVCPDPACKYDALPVLDGYLWSDTGHRAALRIVEAAGAPFELTAPPRVDELDAQTLQVRLDGRYTFTFAETGFTLQGSAEAAWELAATWSPAKPTAFLGVEPGRLCYRHEGYPYAVAVLSGSSELGEAGFTLRPDPVGRIQLGFVRED